MKDEFTETTGPGSVIVHSLMYTHINFPASIFCGKLAFLQKKSVRTFAVGNCSLKVCIKEPGDGAFAPQ